jgi:hypothetical protein
MEGQGMTEPPAPPSERSLHFMGRIPEEDRTPVEFFARLVNAPDLTSLITEERTFLAYDMLRSFRLVIPSELLGEPVARSGGFGEILARLQEEAKVLIGGLIAGEPVAPILALEAATPTWRLSDGRVIEEWNAEGKSAVRKRWLDTLRWQLFGLLRTVPFPYGRCGHCKQVFVTNSDARMKYCSAECAYRQREAAGREAKNAYMRSYMRRRRAETRRAKAPARAKRPRKGK